MKPPRTKGLFAISHSIREFDEAVLWELYTLWKAPIIDVRGRPLEEEEMRAYVRGVASGAHGGRLAISPPNRRSKEAPFYWLDPKPWTKSIITKTPDEDKGIESGEATLEWAIFEAALMRYALLSAFGGPNIAGSERLHEKEGSDRFLDACRRVRDVLRGYYAFGGAWEEFLEPDLDDPRVRAWGVTYYGRSLVEELGRDRLRSAPAHRVEFDDEGGCWVQLVELPFLTGVAKERRREDLEAHLELRERFGGG